MECCFSVTALAFLVFFLWVLAWVLWDYIWGGKDA